MRKHPRSSRLYPFTETIYEDAMPVQKFPTRETSGIVYSFFRIGYHYRTTRSGKDVRRSADDSARKARSRKSLVDTFLTRDRFEWNEVGIFSKEFSITGGSCTYKANKNAKFPRFLNRSIAYAFRSSWEEPLFLLLTG